MSDRDSIIRHLALRWNGLSKGEVNFLTLALADLEGSALTHRALLAIRVLRKLRTKKQAT